MSRNHTETRVHAIASSTLLGSSARSRALSAVNPELGLARALGRRPKRRRRRAAVAVAVHLPIAHEFLLPNKLVKSSAMLHARHFLFSSSQQTPTQPNIT